MSSALMFSNLSKFHLEGGDYTTEILEAIGKIEQQTTFSCDDVINILKGFRNYKEQKPSEALKQKLTRWVRTYGEKHIESACDAFQILKYSDGVIDAGTLRPLLHACRERRENLLDTEKPEFDAICKHRRFAENSSFTPNSTEQSQPLRQESEKSEISEDDTSRSHAAAGREPRENDPGEIFDHMRNMPEELLQDAFPKKSKPRVRQESGESEIREVLTSGPQEATVSKQEVLRMYEMMEELVEKSRAGGGDGLQTSATGGGDGLQTPQGYKMVEKKRIIKEGKNGAKNGAKHGAKKMDVHDKYLEALIASLAGQKQPTFNIHNHGGTAAGGNAAGGNATAGNGQAGRSWCGGLFYCSLCGMGTTASAAAVILAAAYLYFKNPLAIFESIPDVVLESLKKSGGVWASGGSNITNKEHKKNVRVPDETKGEHTHTDKKETKGEHTHTDQNETKGEREIHGFEPAMRELDCFAEPNSECVSRQVQEVFKAIKFGTAGLRKVVGPEMGFERGFWIIVMSLISGGSFNSIRPMTNAGFSSHHRNNNFNPTRPMANAASAMAHAASEIANAAIKCEPFTRP
jgi:hypothetical protein